MVNQPVFMRRKDQITESLMKESDEGCGHENEGEWVGRGCGELSFHFDVRKGHRHCFPSPGQG